MNIEQLQKTLHASQYAEQVLSLHQATLEHDYAIDQFQQSLSTAQIQQLVYDHLVNIQDENTWMKVLRILRARLMFRWIWQDANQLTNVVKLTRELSDFADACIVAAKDFARIPLLAKHGEPMGYNGKLQDLIVIGMGKLGAQELNLSSDIDLIFAFDEQGESNGRKCIDVQQFCILWGQKLIYLLDHITADGFVFRVDMRLRPWGDGSALAISHVALEKYLSQHGREWERYAWIKARIITGGQDGDSLLDMTRPFVFRKYVDYTAFEAMREMKAMIEREVARRNIADDIKLGAGGIREVEFIVQVFQLIYGGAKLELQDRQCLVSLKHLGEAGLLDHQSVEDLEDAYLFLRRVEHAIQALNDQQTQSLPTEPELRQRIIDTLGFDDWAAFIDFLNQKRSKVTFQFEHLIKEKGLDSPIESFSQLESQLNEILDSNAQNLIHEFWYGHAIKKLPAKAVQRLKEFWPHLVEAVLQSNSPQVALMRLMPLVESVMRRTVYLVMLIESKGALQRLVKMATVSPWICEELTHYPVLLDEFLSMDFELPRRDYLEDSLRQQLLRIEIDQVEDQMRVLRLFKKSNVLTVAASDVLAESPLMKVSDALTDIAEVSVIATLNLAYQTVAKRHGYPVDAEGLRCSLDHMAYAVIGYGKVGGIELGYGSDLDLVFIHYMDEQADTDGQKAISGFEFAMRVAQKFMSLMTTQTLDGRVYEIDTRLRPSGEAGLLVTSLKAFEQYQLKSAWLWEHQAIVRARSIAGEQSLRAKFEELRCRVLTLPREEETVRKEVLNMRQKMKDHLGSSKDQKKDGIFHLKQDAGGIVDIEFMAQYVVLAWSGTNPDLAHYSDNVRILEDAAKAGCLSSDDVSALIQAYLSERAESHRLALANHNMQVSAADWHDTREVVCKLWQRLIDPTASFALESE
ncbi:bifunctional [glutamate--ammonia ligase]-adenylyl-L-tyrosine phosphorylase/[glutamate--ammonia-ligase] adenylyltransferase [Acinetobacter guillouiae]|jgi:glutamate-ammonia-ligase adenylyltransferase|uniref:bifunctional [glutamate--ammonia ligase]-adenylyl-L-tyrosine phosphorylase/[glutamate--ammonia-ligase] adenylyltransferase n=1 Tax=Acinetobacter guillouiae TaxID=106649 RepID=UPI0002CDEDDA|nr:bifunctional [glutamate--ammonia ligase]-adenylyl-L-tyrosine phosphorylase/[glutamate--ammonia-ligase] adenylyltransferase [Acinetobacter guillouiae]ENU59012.1 glutamate-ammonia-ligase adenylyltransferase [Acinetobacter guillouiae CIP 63.46]EPH33850.1 Glutamate-ammonia-ligase adenylyltransferase [Acinetobacter guillouiae MSP4-18]KAB0625757.1 bifunctional [glutamate--ammonia ligase]-adenylyl-L-tyrosine phosphorylase/[glutamate--ammonia-ligase] adenylyltransferase [Acinetobacter guillouiae]